jgi:hypothetical protein
LPGGASPAVLARVPATKCIRAFTRLVQCVYSNAEPKKRGPKPGQKQANLVEENARLRAEVERLRSLTSQVALSDPKQSLLPRAVWSLSGPIIPTAEESEILATYFAFSNRVLPAVDRDYFYAALDAFKYLQPSGGAGGSGGVKEPPPFTAVQRNSELFGFRVCYYTLLTIGSRIMNKCAASRRYYELARAFIGPCYSQPSQHLVSALLLMTMISRAVSADTAQAALHAALALRMSELVEVTPEVRMVAVVFNAAHSSTTAATGGASAAGSNVNWPPLERPPGAALHMRFADILGFIISQLMMDFPLMPQPPAGAEAAAASLQLQRTSSAPTAAEAGAEAAALPLPVTSFVKLAEEAVALQRGA